MTRELVVWHVFGTMKIGGAELRTLELDAAIRPSGVRFEYMTLARESGPLTGQIEESGTRVHSLPLGWSWPWRVWKALRRAKPSAIDSHVATFSGAVVALAWLAGVPVRVAHFRSDGDGHRDTMRRRLQRRMMRALIHRFATDIVGVSPSSLRDGYRVDWEDDVRAQVIPNGIPLRAVTQSPSLRSELGLEDSVPLVIHVGRPSPEKNRALAVRAVHALRTIGTDAHLVLVGGVGADEHSLSEARTQAGGSWLHEVGARDDARDLMAQADALILTSDREGLPGVVLEALSVGTPCLSTDLPGARYIAERVGGTQIVESETPSDWARDIRSVLAVGGEQQREQLSAAFVRGPFSMEAAVSAHKKLYRRCPSEV